MTNILLIEECVNFVDNFLQKINDSEIEDDQVLVDDIFTIYYNWYLKYKNITNSIKLKNTFHENFINENYQKIIDLFSNKILLKFPDHLDFYYKNLIIVLSTSNYIYNEFFIHSLKTQESEID